MVTFMVVLPALHRQLCWHLVPPYGGCSSGHHKPILPATSPAGKSNRNTFHLAKMAGTMHATRSDERKCARSNRVGLIESVRQDRRNRGESAARALSTI
jgi:hypothetical protein